MPNHVHYRETTVFKALQATIDEMILQGQLTKAAADIIVTEFDRSINGALNKHVGRNIKFKGELSSYGFFRDVWTIVLKNPVITDSNQGQHNTTTSAVEMPKITELKIIAMNSTM